MEEQITISKKEYNYLVKRNNLLGFLEARGVDNWSGYRHPPEREDYETDEEYQKALEKAYYDW